MKRFSPPQQTFTNEYKHLDTTIFDVNH